MTSLTTTLYTLFRGTHAGTDSLGNRYYKRSRGQDVLEERWVIYKGDQEASKVPAAWHGWLHHTVKDVPQAREPYAWEKSHQPNLTGTSLAVYPKGHPLSHGERAQSRGDYRAWTPEGSSF